MLRTHTFDSLALKNITQPVCICMHLCACLHMRVHLGLQHMYTCMGIEESEKGTFHKELDWHSAAYQTRMQSSNILPEINQL